MASINNLKELNSLGRNLTLNDVLCFNVDEKVIKYYVEKSYCRNPNEDNSDIFGYINLNTSQAIIDFTYQCYGYDEGGLWPYFKEGDYEALGRMVRKIYELLKDKYNPDLDPEDFINSRFEILDL